ncbi:MAG: hypothetical protein ACYCPS_04355 [Candidatus Saccharimonadales bacterium]
MNVVTESFTEEMLWAESTTFPVVIFRALGRAAHRLRLLRKYEREFQPHGHETPIDGLGGLRDAGAVLGYFGKQRDDDAIVAAEMSSQISEFLGEDIAR